MKKEIKIVLFTVIVAIISIALVVLRYEKLLQEYRKAPQLSVVKGGTSVKELTAAEIIEKIKASKEYLGDSIIIFEDGRMVSSNQKFQGTINAVLNSRANMEIVSNNCTTNNLPVQYNVYILAAIYYRDQYKDEFK